MIDGRQSVALLLLALPWFGCVAAESARDPARALVANQPDRDASLATARATVDDALSRAPLPDRARWLQASHAAIDAAATDLLAVGPCAAGLVARDPSPYLDEVNGWTARCVALEARGQAALAQAVDQAVAAPAAWAAIDDRLAEASRGLDAAAARLAPLADATPRPAWRDAERQLDQARAALLDAAHARGLGDSYGALAALAALRAALADATRALDEAALDLARRDRPITLAAVSLQRVARFELALNGFVGRQAMDSAAPSPWLAVDRARFDRAVADGFDEPANKRVRDHRITPVYLLTTRLEGDPAGADERTRAVPAAVADALRAHWPEPPPDDLATDHRVEGRVPLWHKPGGFWYEEREVMVRVPGDWR